MTKEIAIKMIDEYLVEPNNIAKEWVECLEFCRTSIIDNDYYKMINEALIEGQKTLQQHIIKQNAEIERINNTKIS